MFRKQIIQKLLLILLINNYQDFLNQCCTVSICKTGWFCVSSSNVSHLTVSELHENEFVYRSQRWKVKILLCFWNNLCTLTAQKNIFFWLRREDVCRVLLQHSLAMKHANFFKANLWWIDESFLFKFDQRHQLIYLKFKDSGAQYHVPT